MFEGVEVLQEEPLAPYTTLHMGGPAEYLALVKNETDLYQVLSEAKAAQMPLYFLGGGSNLLVSDAGVRGVVVHLTGDFLRIHMSPDGRDISVGAAYSFPKLTRHALELGWERALGWCGVPGSVGGALKMNAGTRQGELGEVVLRVEAMTENGALELSHDDMGFSYRNTHFPPNAVLCRTYLHYPQPQPERKLELLHEAQELAKKRKATQPKFRSAGSMFKNPPGDYAGRLIEACGLKGTQIGGARISELHANFFLNYAQASSKDMLAICELARKKVYDQFGIVLEYEVRHWGFEDK